MTALSILNTTDKTQAGTGTSRALRRQGHVPAVLYGKGCDSLMLALDGRELRKEIKKGGFFNRLFSFTIQGKEYRAVARDIQLHPVSDDPIHVDFMRVEPGSRVTVSVPVVLTHQEKCPGLKRGGVLNFVAHTVEIDCPVDTIPDQVEVSLAELDIHDSVHLSDVKLGDGVSPHGHKDLTIVTVVAPTLKQDTDAQAEGAAEGAAS